MEKTMKFEMFWDDAYFDMWAVRPEGDTDFNSPRLVHFAVKQMAESYKEWAELGQWAVKIEKPPLGSYMCGCGEEVLYEKESQHDEICDGGEDKK